MPVDVDSYDRVAAKIKEMYGDASIRKGSDSPVVDRISTGSLELDFATGGGIPIGRFSRFYGGYSSGKTLTCMNVIKNAQQMRNEQFPNGMKVAYYNIEKQYDRLHFENAGIDVDALEVIEGTTIEETGTKLEALVGAVHLHILDSLSSAISIDELKANLEDWQMGLAARAWGKVLRRALERFDHHENTIILVDQVRDVFGSGGEEPPGGRFIEHTSSMSLYFRKGSWLFYNEKGVLDPDAKQTMGLSESVEADGVEMQVRVNKSRVCRPLRTARPRLDLQTMEFDRLNELAKIARFFDLARRSGSWYEINGVRRQGLHGLREIIATDEGLQEEIVARLDA